MSRKRREAGLEEAEVAARDEESCVQPELRHVVSSSPMQPFDEAMKTKAPEVIGHLPRAKTVAENPRNMLSEITVGETLWEQPEEHEGREESKDTTVTEAKSWCALLFIDSYGPVNATEGVFADEAIVADPLDIQETSVGLEADLP